MVKGTGYQNENNNKKEITENCVKKLRPDDTENHKADSNLNIRNHNNKIIVAKELKLTKYP